MDLDIKYQIALLQLDLFRANKYLYDAICKIDIKLEPKEIDFFLNGIDLSLISIFNTIAKFSEYRSSGFWDETNDVVKKMKQCKEFRNLLTHSNARKFSKSTVFQRSFDYGENIFISLTNHTLTWKIYVRYGEESTQLKDDVQIVRSLSSDEKIEIDNATLIDDNHIFKKKITTKKPEIIISEFQKRLCLLDFIDINYRVSPDPKGKILSPIVELGLNIYKYNSWLVNELTPYLDSISSAD